MNILGVMTKFVPKIMVVMCCLSWADGMKMNEKILPPALWATNEKLEANLKEMCSNRLLLCELKLAPKTSADEFGDLFVECVEQTLTDLLGTKVREVLLDYFARHDRLAIGDIPGHPRELSMLFDKTFGKCGIMIEKCIMRRFYALLGWEYKEASNFNFSNQVEVARACWKTSQAAGRTDRNSTRHRSSLEKVCVGFVVRATELESSFSECVRAMAPATMDHHRIGGGAEAGLHQL